MKGLVDSIHYFYSDVDSFRSHTERMRAFYSDDLSYREVYKLNIGKGDFKHYFVNPKIGEIINEKKSHISIRWCTDPRIAAHFWE